MTKGTNTCCGGQCRSGSSSNGEGRGDVKKSYGSLDHKSRGEREYASVPVQPAVPLSSGPRVQKQGRKLMDFGRHEEDRLLGGQSVDLENKIDVPAPKGVDGAQHGRRVGQCARESDPDGPSICCRDLQVEDDRNLIDPDLVRDIIIGLADGLTVPFALTAGLSSLGSAKLVVIGGAAELISGAISMGLGGFLSAKAERDHYLYMLKHTKDRVHRSCAGEMEREVISILAPFGTKESDCARVAQGLREVEESHLVLHHGTSSGDTGLSAFLLRFGQGLECVKGIRMWISALTIGVSYAIGGLIPMIVSRAGLKWLVFLVCCLPAL